MLWTKCLDFCFNLASISTFMTLARLVAMSFKFLAELIDGFLTPSVPMGTVLDTILARRFESWI